MLLYELKDFVREHFGRLGIPSSLVNIGLTEARKLIEKEANFWWMRGIADFSAVVNTSDYVIGSGLAIDIANFKDARALQFKVSTDHRWQPVGLGTKDQEELNMMYDDDDEGEPEIAVLDNVTLKIYPPKPQVTYDMRLYYYKWTDNPTDNTDTDDLLKNYGMALAYGALIWGFEIELKDMQGAAYWRVQLGGAPFGRGGEIAKLKRENFKRDWKDKVMFEPHDGPGARNKRSWNNIQIYMR